MFFPTRLSGIGVQLRTAILSLCLGLLLSSIPFVSASAQPRETTDESVEYLAPPPGIDGKWARVFHELADPLADSLRVKLENAEERRLWVGEELAQEMLLLRWVDDAQLREDTLHRIDVLMAVWRGPEDVLMGPLFRPRELENRDWRASENTESGEPVKVTVTPGEASEGAPLEPGRFTRKRKNKSSDDPDTERAVRSQEGTKKSTKANERFLVAFEKQSNSDGGQSAAVGSKEGIRETSGMIQDVAGGSRNQQRPGLSPQNRMEKTRYAEPEIVVDSESIIQKGLMTLGVAVLAIVALALYRRRPDKVEREQAATKRLLEEKKHLSSSDQGGMIAGSIPSRRMEADTQKTTVKEDPKQRSPLRILMAEDNKVHQKLGLRMLKQLGYEADLAKDGVEAVRAARRDHYDVVLMDVQMPRLNGIGAAKEIREEARQGHAPYIVAVTASDDREGLLAQGMDDFVAKPIRVLELNEALKRAIKVKRPYRSA
ncbi:MAG: response regulator [Candidatus Eisenbacteria bacterium]|uniref:Response regulator n=1 Tax=Eiseniibacteriota bacterium TaxID=2212470 RepID=A0A7Y2H2V5_UNCEI|nr:response regulator [Candidatus Eisenbacteria bacterium]